MFKRIFLIVSILVTFLTPSLAQEGGKYSIKTMTPEVQQSLDGRKSRFHELHSLKSDGIVGENNHGYVELLKEDSQAKELVDAENNDRSTIYKTIAQQNDLLEQLSIIESAFAAIKRERANTGEKIQSEDGHWVTK